MSGGWLLGSWHAACRAGPIHASTHCTVAGACSRTHTYGRLSSSAQHPADMLRYQPLCRYWGNITSDLPTPEMIAFMEVGGTLG